MKYFAQSALKYICEQSEQHVGGTKLLFMMPSMPPGVVKDVGDGLTTYASQSPLPMDLTVKVAKALTDTWSKYAIPGSSQLLSDRARQSWFEENEVLTKYRSKTDFGDARGLILLIGVDRVTDSASMEDFHHCDFATIWNQQLEKSFAHWVRAALNGKVAFEEDTVQQFECILQPLVSRGLADILQVSSLLQNLNLDAAQDGRDAVRILLGSLGVFGLPAFYSFRFTTQSAFVAYLDDAVAFFAYDSFLEDRNREKALKAIRIFRENNPPGDLFDPSDLGVFNKDVDFLDSLESYVRNGDADKRELLKSCDFVTVRDRIFGYKPPREKGGSKPAKVTKLSGGPVEMALSALWATLGDYKRQAVRSGVIPHEALSAIRFHSLTFKHDSDGESAEERRETARLYLRRLLGGVDEYLRTHIGAGRICSEDEEASISSDLLHDEIDYQPARTAEPFLLFEVSLKVEGWDEDICRPFAWRLPEIQPYRVADELVRWAASNIGKTKTYCLPIFNVPYYEELLLAKDDEETRRVLLQCVHEEGDWCRNLLTASEMPGPDPLRPKTYDLAYAYASFVQTAAARGLHVALLEKWDELRQAYQSATDAYLCDSNCANSPLATILFRAFLIIAKRPLAEGDRWMWDKFEPSAVVTVLHPALLEMLQAHIVYLLTSFSSVAARELRSPGSTGFSDGLWQGYVDLAKIQTPLSGILKDQNRILDTDIRGSGLIHRIGNVPESDAPLTTRLLLRYDSVDEDDISDAELFRDSRESTLISRILEDYRKLHPHANDGLSIAVYQNEDIQPIIAAVDDYLSKLLSERDENRVLYAMSVTIFTESTDDCSVARWISQWKERWEASESQQNLKYYRKTRLSVAHRIVSPEKNYQQFVSLIEKSLDVDVAILNSFIRAGSQGNDFEQVTGYDVRSRTLKFPVLEKPFCASSDPGHRLQRARILSNRQFRLTTNHAEIMARLKYQALPPGASHVVLGFGDYGPWQRAVDALHTRAEWVVCIDPNIDERLLAERSSESQETREIIGFGSGVGTHGGANYTISTQQFRIVDILHKLEPAITDVYTGWDDATVHNVAESVLLESRRLSGLSLVRATGIGDYVRDFMGYALTRKLLKSEGNTLCDQLISLDAFKHWFDSAETYTRPDLLWLVARLNESGKFEFDLRLIECKMAKEADGHLEKARQQLEAGLAHLSAVFRPRTDDSFSEDDRPDQRYWWLQLYRLVASKAEIALADQREILAALERLSEGDFDVCWRAAAITFWTDQNDDRIECVDTWPYALGAQELGIDVIACGSEVVRNICKKTSHVDLPWTNSEVCFASTIPMSVGALDSETEESNAESVDDQANAGRKEQQASEDVPLAGSTLEPLSSSVSPPIPQGFEIPQRVLLGRSTSGSRDVYWEFGHSELNNRHMLIFGSSGMGKTYTIQCLLYELGRKGQNSLIVDYTNGFFDNQLEEEFRKQLQPVQHLLRKSPLSINPFRQQVEPIGDELLPEPPSSTAQRVSGVFSGVYNFGDQQKSALYQAIKSGLETRGKSGMTLADLIPELELLTEQKGSVAQSASSVVSKLIPFTDQRPFGEEDPESWEKLFSDIQHRCHILQLAGFMKDAARLVTEFSLIDLYWFYRSKGSKRKPRVVVLDEVQNLDHRDESPLAQLLREGRKFGFSLILATQIMSNLEKDEKDRLFNSAHKLFFRPADTEVKTYAEIAAMSTNEKPEAWIKKLVSLGKGECYSLGPSLNDGTGRLEVKAFRIKVTSLDERRAHA